MSVHGAGHVIKVKVWHRAREIDVGFVECADGSKIFPIAVEKMPVGVIPLDGERDHLVSEIDCRGIRQQIDQNTSSKEIDAHGSKIGSLGGLPRIQAVGRAVRAHFGKGVARRFFPELENPALVVELQQAERRSLLFASGYDADAYVGIAAPVTFQQGLIVHAVQLIARQNQHVIVVTSRETMKMLPHRVGCSLEPLAALHCLFGRKHLDKAFAELIKSVT